jgi:protein phosphatase
VITRALGPEGVVDVETRSFSARAGDVYLLCSDGLTTMISEQEILELLLSHPRLHDAGEALIDAANAAGGRDNVTVILLRLEEVESGLASGEAEGAAEGADPATRGPASRADEQHTVVGLPAITAGAAAAFADSSDGARSNDGAHSSEGTHARRRSAAEAWRETATVRRLPRAGARRGPAARRRRRLHFRHLKTLIATLVVTGVFACAAWLVLTNVYFIATNGRGLVTMYEGLPYRLPGNVDLYTRQYVSGVDASQVAPARRRTLLNHSLRTEQNAASIIHSLELEQLE